MEATCGWHSGETACAEPYEIFCPECSRAIATRLCEGCGMYFIDWEYSEGFDNFMAGPAATNRGDLCCAACVAGIEREIERADREAGDWFDLSGYGDVDSFNIGETEEE